MAKWYDPWLTSQEKKNLQVGQKGIRARQQAAANNYSNSAANRGYPQSGDSAQKQAAQNAPKTRMKDIARLGYEIAANRGKSMMNAIKVQNKRSMSERNRDRQAIEDAFKKRVRNK